MQETGVRNGAYGADKFGFKDLAGVRWNLTAPSLYEYALKAGEASLVEGGAPDCAASPIWARYHAICSGVSSLAWAAAGRRRAAASAKREMRGSEIMPAIVMPNSLRGAE